MRSPRSPQNRLRTTPVPNLVPKNKFGRTFCDPALRRSSSEARPRGARRGGPERTEREEGGGGRRGRLRAFSGVDGMEERAQSLSSVQIGLLP